MRGIIFQPGISLLQATIERAVAIVDNASASPAPIVRLPGR